MTANLPPLKLGTTDIFHKSICRFHLATEWTDLPHNSSPPRTVDGLSGISISHIAVGGSESDASLFVCLVTDRGILLTRGSGRDGCLGHGDRKSVDKPKVRIWDQTMETFFWSSNLYFSDRRVSAGRGSVDGGRGELCRRQIIFFIFCISGGANF